MSAPTYSWMIGLYNVTTHGQPFFTLQYLGSSEAFSLSLNQTALFCLLSLQGTT